VGCEFIGTDGREAEWRQTAAGVRSRFGGPLVCASNQGVEADVRMQAGQERTVHLSPGDMLILYTDGLTEAQNEQQEFFGENRLLAIGQAGVGHPAQDILEAIMAQAHQFVGDAPQSDDITLAVVTRNAW